MKLLQQVPEASNRALADKKLIAHYRVALLKIKNYSGGILYHFVSFYSINQRPLRSRSQFAAFAATANRLLKQLCNDFTAESNRAVIAK
jgi:hypothetical protein